MGHAHLPTHVLARPLTLGLLAAHPHVLHPAKIMARVPILTHAHVLWVTPVLFAAPLYVMLLLVPMVAHVLLQTLAHVHQATQIPVVIQLCATILAFTVPALPLERALVQ
jgi:hypothetical protein